MAFARGARMGVRMISRFSLRKSGVEAVAELAVAIVFALVYGPSFLLLPMLLSFLVDVRVLCVSVPLQTAAWINSARAAADAHGQ
jgi:hypothetical protein